MHAELRIPAATLLAFLLVLARMTGVFVFVPLPFKDAGPSIARIVLAVGSTVALYARWPVLAMEQFTLGTVMQLVLSDAALGAAIGLMVGFLSEAFTMGAQTLALQAGYGYASVVDPTTQADSDVLAVMAQMLASMFFFTFGLHRYLFKVFADSLERFPPGSFFLTPALAQLVIRLAAGVFSTGLRLALPVIALLLMVEITLALLGRLNAQMHLGVHAFSAKMLITLVALGSLLAVTPALYSRYAEDVFNNLRGVVGH